MLPVFTSEEVAEERLLSWYAWGDSFILKLGLRPFYDALKDYKGVGQVAINIGTADAQIYQLEEFLDTIRPESQN